MKILISAYTGIGNLIQLTVLVQNIIENFPSADIMLLGDDKWNVFELIPNSISVKKISKKRGLSQASIFYKFFKNNNFDYIIFPFTGTPTIVQTVGYISSNAFFCQHVDSYSPGKTEFIAIFSKYILRRKASLVPVLKSRLEVDLYLDLLQTINNLPIERNYTSLISYKKSNYNVISKFKINALYICIQAGAANSGVTPKRWPASNFNKLIKMLLIEFPNFSIVLLGDKTEKHNIDFENKNVISLEGKTDLQDLLAVIDNSELVVCHDSGIMHIANALKTPLVALYGPTDFTRTAPLGEKSVVVRNNIKCSPCMYGGSLSESDAYRMCSRHSCMLDLSPRKVFDTVKGLIIN